MFRSAREEPLRCLIVFLDQFLFVHSAQLSFFDDEPATDYRVIRVDGLTKNDRGNGIVHSGKTNAIEINGEKVRSLPRLQAANIGSS